ncbi:DNA polymerase III subunit beta [Paenibacillus apiarius]|uniref:DNA polymerase III subunit beta n=1 Tax=Paenibacillus apiarius TaxID=46240 RepID=UPI003B3B767F
MLIEVPQPILAVALQHVMRAVSANCPIPILSGILLRANREGLTLTGGNSSMMVQYKIPVAEQVNVRRDGSLVIPAKYWSEIVRKLPAGVVSLETVEPLIVTVRSGNAIYRLCGMDAEHFPPMPAIHDSLQVRMSSAALRAMIRHVVFAVSPSEKRPVLTGVSCHIDCEGKLRFLATDSVRLASRATRVELAQDMVIPASSIIPGKNVRELSKMLNEDLETIEVTIGKSQIGFRTKNLMFQSALIEGTYPSLDRLIPQIHATEFVVDSIELLRAMERVSLLAGDENMVQLSINEHTRIELISKTAEIGEVLEEVQAEKMSGERLSICFNGHYMKDILRAVNAVKLRFACSGKWSPIVVQPVEDAELTYVITPLRAHI